MGPLLLQTLAVQFTFEARDVIDEQRALEMVDLMLKANRLESLDLDFNFFLIDGPTMYQDSGRSLYIGGVVDDAQTAFLGDDQIGRAHV